LPLFCHNPLDGGYARSTIVVILGQEDYAGALEPTRRKLNAHFTGNALEEILRQRCEYTGSVSRVLVASHRTTVGHVEQNFFSRSDDRVALFTLYMRNKAHAATVVFTCRIVEAGLLRP